MHVTFVSFITFSSEVFDPTTELWSFEKNSPSIIYNQTSSQREKEDDHGDRRQKLL